MDFDKKFPILGDYFLVKSLGTGLNSKVKLGYNKQDGKYYAIKIMKNTGKVSLNQRAINTEVSIMSHLKHQNLISLKKEQTIDDLIKPNGTAKKVLYIVLEYAGGGELFDYIANTGNFSESIARYYLNQLLQAVEYLHGQNFSHRDLKPENILLDEQFNLKLADFGFTTVLGGHDGLGKLRTQLGTESYMAPEINLKLTYSGIAIDLFAVGIILFVMCSGNPPFNRADPKDIYFKQLCTNKHQIFWDAHLKFKENKNFYSQGFQNVVNSLLAFDPTQRMTIAELRQHPWVKGPVAKKEEVIQEMLERKNKLNLIKEKNRVQKQLAKEQQKAQQIKNEIVKDQQGIYAAFGGLRNYQKDQENQFALIKSKFPTIEAERKLYIYQESEEIPLNLNNVYTHINPQQVWHALIKHCSEKFDNVNIHDKMMKITCQNQKEDEDLIKFTIKMYQTEEQLTLIEFERKEVQFIIFLTYFQGPIILNSKEINSLKELVNSF